jgi:hypothetical protein
MDKTSKTVVGEIARLFAGEWAGQKYINEQRRVLIVYTGGTIGMKKIDGSLAPCPGYLQEEMSKMEELKNVGYVWTIVISLCLIEYLTLYNLLYLSYCIFFSSFLSYDLFVSLCISFFVSLCISFFASLCISVFLCVIILMFFLECQFGR